MCTSCISKAFYIRLNHDANVQEIMAWDKSIRKIDLSFDFDGDVSGH